MAHLGVLVHRLELAPRILRKAGLVLQRLEQAPKEFDVGVVGRRGDLRTPKGRRVILGMKACSVAKAAATRRVWPIGGGEKGRNRFKSWRTWEDSNLQPSDP